MKKIKVAHFGIAHDHSPFAMEAMRKYPDIFEVVGVCEPDEEMRKQFGSNSVYADLPWLTEQELLEREDITAVACEGHELRSVSDAQKCIDAGKFVHLDKPGGVDLAAFKRLLDSSEKKELCVHMGYMYRWNPAMIYVREAVKNGELGTITGIDCSFSIQYQKDKKCWLKQFPGGMMFFLGCHSLDMIMQLMGTPDKVVPFNRSSGYENDGAQDSCFAVFEYQNGVATVRSSGVEANGYYERTLKVVGTKGTIKVQPLETPTLVRRSYIEDGIDHPWHDYSISVFPGYPNGRYDDMMLEFAAIARGDIQNPWSNEYEYQLQKTLLQASQ